MIKYLLLFLSLTACGNIKIIEPKYLVYVEGFERESVTQGKPIVITDLIVISQPDLENIGPKTIGVCWPYTIPIIEISTQYWERANEADRESLLYHELTHCLLGRDHDETFITDPEVMPKSIMYPSAFDSDLYMKYHDYYMREMFHFN